MPLNEIQPDGTVIGDGLTITGDNSVLRGLVLNVFRGAIKIKTDGANVMKEATSEPTPPAPLRQPISRRRKDGAKMVAVHLDTKPAEAIP